MRTVLSGTTRPAGTGTATSKQRGVSQTAAPPAAAPRTSAAIIHTMTFRCVRSFIDSRLCRAPCRGQYDGGRSPIREARPPRSSSPRSRAAGGWCRSADPERRREGAQLCLDRALVLRAHAQEVLLRRAEPLQRRIRERVRDHLGRQLDVAVDDGSGEQRANRGGERLVQRPLRLPEAAVRLVAERPELAI